MSSLATLRIYMPSGTRAKKSGFLKGLTSPLLSLHLLRSARAKGVTQAIIYNVSAGYLAGQKITYSHPELNALSHPVCVELVGEEAVLRRFLVTYSEMIKGLSCFMSATEECV